MQEQATKDGIKVSHLSATERARFKAATEVVYDQYQDYFTAGLIDSIKRS